jgi:hypothetical protein
VAQASGAAGGSIDAPLEVGLVRRPWIGPAGDAPPPAVPRGEGAGGDVGGDDAPGKPPRAAAPSSAPATPAAPAAAEAPGSAGGAGPSSLTKRNAAGGGRAADAGEERRAEPLLLKMPSVRERVAMMHQASQRGLDAASPGRPSPGRPSPGRQWP